jgi:integration host factor subunit alpha
MTLTKDHLITSVSIDVGITKTRSTQLIDSLLEIMKMRLEKGEDLLISGFGKFSVKKKAERRGRNPATGEDLRLAKRKVVTFKRSKRLIDRVNGK